ncbi:hypothetical protein FW755_02825 [Lonepinella koalarum]|uniref:Lipoprotein n=1 Tax=Lonepinella koalarum TaxID=53417 RepID=A0A4R1KWD8_9PAST|nr:hypothetical protein [Lonepinella koalarum]MDH2926486.1 hypothetical protein [Lonepinella koalarum]TCK69576.1 hypothetical protein EV692_1500 [Lonepinella koalarum]TFJ89821.1 hypothetical protein E0709_06770 [Lonepinella koalarum]TYG34092.1 hypothetical protein FW755_02825 [Lonepinella koalarum]
MKKIVFMLACILLTACASHPEVGQPQAPLDMASVNAYNTKVYHGDTVPASQKVKQAPVNMPLNASDSQPKTTTKTTTPVVLMPSIGYHYGRYRW